MLPKGPLGYAMLKKLKCYAGAAHPHAAQQPKTLRHLKPTMIGNYYYGTGRRKSAVARVFIKKGTGKIVVNDKPVDEFFSREPGRMVVRQPLELTNHETTFDIMVNVERRRRIRPGRRGAPRHHPRADRLRRGAEAHAVEGRARHARRARGRAQEGRPAQGAPPQAVLEALTGTRASRTRRPPREAAFRFAARRRRRAGRHAGGRTRC